MTDGKHAEAILSKTSQGTKLVCPKDCGKHILSLFSEGVVIHTEHYNSETKRREKHHILIPWDRLDELRAGELRAIGT